MKKKVHKLSEQPYRISAAGLTNKRGKTQREYKQNYTNLHTNHPQSTTNTPIQIHILLQLHGHPAADLHLSVKVLLTVPGVVLVSPAGTQLLHLFRADKVQRLGHHPLHALTVRRGRE